MSGRCCTAQTPIRRIVPASGHSGAGRTPVRRPAGAIAASGCSGSDRTPVHRSVSSEWPFPRPCGPDAGAPEHPRRASAPALAGCRSAGASPASSHSSSNGRRSAETSPASGSSGASRTPVRPFASKRPFRRWPDTAASAASVRSDADRTRICQSVLRERSLRRGPYASPPERPPRAATVRRLYPRMTPVNGRSAADRRRSARS